LTIQESAQVDAIIGGVDEWIAHGFRRDLEYWSCNRKRLQPEIAFNAQFCRRSGERRERYRIAEYIVDPAYRSDGERVRLVSISLRS
jgi:hypothetical protein